jgi:hypothetical protein
MSIPTPADPVEKCRMGGEPSFEPRQLMRAAVEAMIEVCEVMQGVRLTPVGPVTPAVSGGIESGSCISLTRPERSWNLAVFGTGPAVRSLAGAFFGKAPGEDVTAEEVADALGEILNMVAGVVKRKVAGARAIQIGLPLFLSGTDSFRYLASGIRLLAQRVAGAELDMEVIFVWKEEA